MFAKAAGRHGRLHARAEPWWLKSFRFKATFSRNEFIEPKGDTALTHQLIRLAMVSLLSMLGATAQAQAPSPGGWDFTLDGGFAVQPEADLDGGAGAYSLDRVFLSAGVDYRWNYRNSVGLSVGGGKTDYTFKDEDGDTVDGPWGEIDDLRVSVPMRFALGQTSTLFAIPTLRYNGEGDADSGDSQTWGLLGGVAWRLSEDLTIGPGLGAFSRLEGSARVFPILLIDWNFGERWSLSTGRGLAASQGPGLTLGYRLSEQWRLGLAGRYEEIQFRLDENGSTPGGVGEDRALPLVFTAAWQPSRSVRIGMFAGVEFGGELTLYDSAGNTIESRDYDTVPVYGATIEFRL